MECPNCGFIQPEDEYCANCGAHIPKALRRRRRRTVIALLVTLMCMGAVGLGAAYWASKHLISTSSPLPGEEGSGPAIERIPSPSSSPAGKPAHRASTKRPSKGAESKASKKGSGPLQAPEAPAPIQEAQPKPADRSTEKTQTPPETGSSEKDMESEIRRWAAQEWVAKGRELADYSREELALYMKALEADPNLAVAHYRIGLIQWKWGLRDPALDAFRQFLRHATKEEREKYPLPAGFTPEELGPAGEPEKP
ncbi:MAG: hypothetical protein ACUVXD_04300 [Thermodesulfobacteriota bacterium]